jgi:hypothetical protein
MNSKSMLRLALVAGLVYGANAGAVDRALYDQYQGYKQRQQRGQQEVLEQARAAASSGSGGAAYHCVLVTAKMICGLGAPWCQTRRLCVSGGPGTVEAGYGSKDGCSTSDVRVCTGYRGALAGTYSWSAQFGEDQNLQVCAGAVDISGAKSNLEIQVSNRTCADAGTHEW